MTDHLSSKKFYQNRKTYSYYGQKRPQRITKTKKYNNFEISIDDELVQGQSKDCEHIVVEKKEQKTQTNFNDENLNTLNIQHNESKQTPSPKNKNITPVKKEKSFSKSITDSNSTQCASSEKNESPMNSLIELSKEDLKDAFYFPKKLSKIYNFVYNQIQICNSYYQQKALDLYERKDPYCIKKANSFQPKNQMVNTFTASPFARKGSFNSGNTNITPFTLNEPAFSINESPIKPKNNLLGLNNIHIGNTLNGTNDPEKESSVKENTDILIVKVKVSKSEIIVFKIRRYDDMFKTIQMFCEINKINPQLEKPIILNVIKALNSIYAMYNINLSERDIQFLNSIKVH